MFVLKQWLLLRGRMRGWWRSMRGERGLSGRQGEACQGLNYGTPPTCESLLFSSHPPPRAVVFSVCVGGSDFSLSGKSQSWASLYEPFRLRKKENFLQNRCRLLMGGLCSDRMPSVWATGNHGYITQQQLSRSIMNINTQSWSSFVFIQIKWITNVVTARKGLRGYGFGYWYTRGTGVN